MGVKGVVISPQFMYILERERERERERKRGREAQPAASSSRLASQARSAVNEIIALGPDFQLSLLRTN